MVWLQNPILSRPHRKKRLGGRGNGSRPAQNTPSVPVPSAAGAASALWGRVNERG